MRRVEEIRRLLSKAELEEAMKCDDRCARNRGYDCNCAGGVMRRGK